ATASPFCLSVVPLGASSPVQCVLPSSATSGGPPTISSMLPTVARQGCPSDTRATIAPCESRTSTARGADGDDGVELWQAARQRAKTMQRTSGGSYQVGGSGAMAGSSQRTRRCATPGGGKMRVCALVCVIACSGKPEPVVRKDGGPPPADAAP